jgi:hypothetical protein
VVVVVVVVVVMVVVDDVKKKHGFLKSLVGMMLHHRPFCDDPASSELRIVGACVNQRSLVYTLS